MCRAAEILHLRSRFADGLLPLACGQSVHNFNVRTTSPRAGAVRPGGEGKDEPAMV